MTAGEKSPTMTTPSKTPQASNFRPPSEIGSHKSSPSWSPPGRPTTAADTQPSTKSGLKSSPRAGAKTELDLLVEALQRLDQHYRLHNQQLDHQLSVLAGQLEHLAGRVNSLTPQVANLAAQLARFKDG